MSDQTSNEKQWQMVQHKLDNGRKPYKVKHYSTKKCKDCLLRNECTQNKLGRIIERTEYAEENNKRVNQNPE